MGLSASVSFSVPKPPPSFDTRAVNPYFAIHDLTWSQQALFWSGWFVSTSLAVQFTQITVMHRRGFQMVLPCLVYLIFTKNHTF